MGGKAGRDWSIACAPIAIPASLAASHPVSCCTHAAVCKHARIPAVSVHIGRAERLLRADLYGRADPYVVVEVAAAAGAEPLRYK